MKNKKVKRLRKEAIQLIKDSGKYPPPASYTGGLWSNPYKNLIRQYRKGVM